MMYDMIDEQCCLIVTNVMQFPLINENVMSISYINVSVLSVAVS